ncbi:MAG TPA: UPF0182 family protein, partial [Candidatus Binatia bacterium]|nr:UPF0182 family protein [Candidatus Binatia bacterium]
LSAESRQLPELKRLIATSGDRVVMAPDVQSLFAALLTERPKPTPVVASSSPAGPPRAQATSGPNSEALRHYRQALEALNKGDWRTFGVEMDLLQKSLQVAAP